MSCIQYCRCHRVWPAVCAVGGWLVCLAVGVYCVWVRQMAHPLHLHVPPYTIPTILCLGQQPVTFQHREPSCGRWHHGPAKVRWYNQNSHYDYWHFCIKKRSFNTVALKWSKNKPPSSNFSADGWQSVTLASETLLSMCLCSHMCENLLLIVLEPFCSTQDKWQSHQNISWQRNSERQITCSC